MRIQAHVSTEPSWTVAEKGSWLYTHRELQGDTDQQGQVSCQVDRQVLVHLASRISHRLEGISSRYIKGKRVSKESNINVGDIVLVHDNLPRCQWRLATVTRVIPSRKDGLERAASLRVSSGNEIRRPIKKLYPLVIPEDSDQTMATPKVDEPAIKGARPKPRESAIRARLKIKQQAVARSDLTDSQLYSSRLSNTCGI